MGRLPVLYLARRAWGSPLGIALGLLLVAPLASADGNHGFGAWKPSCAPNCTSADVFSAGNDASAAEADKAQGESQKLAGDAKNRAELANQIRNDRAELQRQLNQIPPSPNAEAARTAILSKSYVLPEKFNVTSRSLKLNTFRELETRGEKVQKQLMEKAVETRKQAEALNEKARQGFSAARKFNGLESTSNRRAQGMRSASEIGSVAASSSVGQPDPPRASTSKAQPESKSSESNFTAQSSGQSGNVSAPDETGVLSKKYEPNRVLASLNGLEQPGKDKGPPSSEDIMSELDKILLTTVGSLEHKEFLPPAGVGNTGNVVVALLDSAPLPSSSLPKSFQVGQGIGFDPAEISASNLTLFQIMNRRTRAYHKRLAGE